MRNVETKNLGEVRGSEVRRVMVKRAEVFEDEMVGVFLLLLPRVDGSMR